MLSKNGIIILNNSFLFITDKYFILLLPELIFPQPKVFIILFNNALSILFWATENVAS